MMEFSLVWLAEFSQCSCINMASLFFTINHIIHASLIFFRLSFRNCKSCVYNYDDLLSYNSSPHSSHTWFSYIHNFIIILSEPIQGPAPSWLVSSIGIALHRYRRGQGFESRTSLNFFRLSFRNCKSCVYNCDDLLLYKSYHIVRQCMIWDTVFPRIIGGGDYYVFRTKRGRSFEGGDYFKHCSLVAQVLP